MSGLSWLRTATTAPPATSIAMTATSAPSASNSERAGRAVDDRGLGARADPLAADEQRADEVADLVAPDDRQRRRGRLAAAVAGQHDVVGEQRHEPVDVAVGDRLDEAAGELVALLRRRLEARLARVDVRARAGGDLAAVRLAALDDLGDLRERVVEHVVQQEHRPLHRRQRLQHEQERRRDRLAQLGALGRPGGVAVAEHRLGQPLADVGLAPHARRLQLVDRQPRRDGRQERLVGGDRRPLLALAVQAQHRLLHDVLGLPHAAQHPVGDREHVSA